MKNTPSSINLTTLIVLASFSTCLGCKPSPDEALGPTSSFALFTVRPAQPGNPAGIVLERNKGTEGLPAKVNAALIDGFAAEMLRTAFSTQQFIAKLSIPVGPSAQALVWANDAIPFVIGNDLQLGPGRGAAITDGWLGGTVERPKTVWIA
jgi:hypothetical protein